jgi:hypothetical protein
MIALGQVIKVTFLDGIDYIIADRYDESIPDKIWFKWLTKNTEGSAWKSDDVWEYVATIHENNLYTLVDEKEGLSIILKSKK